MSPIRPENRHRSCDFCGTSFAPYRGRKDVRWCSTLCKKRAACAVPRQMIKNCAHCGGSFMPARSAKQVYCALKCKAAGKRARFLADAELQARRRDAQKAYSKTDAYRITQRSAKARRRTVEREGGVTVAEWRAILERFGHRCAYCSSTGPLTMDHVTPIAHGGPHCPGNLAPACGSCNSSKGTSDWSDRLVIPCP